MKELVNQLILNLWRVNMTFKDVLIVAAIAIFLTWVIDTM